MKLSESLRLGSMMVPSLRGPVWSYDVSGKFCGACAIGSALIAIGAFDVETRCVSRREFECWPIVAEDAVHPVDNYPARVYFIIVSLFETHRWTIPQIADWVEGVEQSVEQKVLPEIEEHATA